MDSSFSIIILEGDAQLMVKSMQGINRNLSTGGLLIQDTKKHFTHSLHGQFNMLTEKLTLLFIY